jgi:leader peptidase (prepilin peptidase)/N-methyltransferase
VTPEEFARVSWVAAAAALLLGMNVGSFLNVVAHRLPIGLSVVRPRSRCPACLTPIRATDNIPVLSWLLIRGRCRGCKAAVSVRYAVVEALMGLLSLHVAWVLAIGPARAGQDAAWAQASVVFVAAAAMLAASLIDFDHRILPDEITKSGMWLGPVACAFVPSLVFGREMSVPAWLPPSWPVPLQAALVSGIGVAVGAGLLWALGAVGAGVFGKDAMGFGDVKFLGAIGGFVGPGPVLLALVIAAFAGAAVGLVRLAATGDRYMPFGPFLALGGYVAMLHGDAILGWYLGLALGA